jgi:hypothetical protein
MQDGPRVIRDDMVNDRGELTFAEQTRMTRGPVWGAERVEPEELAVDPPEVMRAWYRATPDDDPWYDVPPGPPVLPDVDTAAWGGHHARRRKSGVDPVPGS